MFKKYGKNEKMPSRSTIRRNAFDILPYKCGLCGNTGNWWGQELVLELHHKNSNPRDNRLDNLVFMCPNCHSLTENYKGRK
jgi:5-methylcytosine-specific restriction endonuclease McrA